MVLLIGGILISCKEAPVITSDQEPVPIPTIVLDTSLHEPDSGATFFFNWYALDSNGDKVTGSDALETMMIYRRLSLDEREIVYDYTSQRDSVETLEYRIERTGRIRYFRPRENAFTIINLRIPSPSKITAHLIGYDTLTIATTRIPAQVYVQIDSTLANGTTSWFIRTDTLWYLPTLKIFGREVSRTTSENSTPFQHIRFARELIRYNT